MKEATEMGFTRMEAKFAELGFEIGALENRLTRRLDRLDDRLSAIEGQNLAVRVADHELRIARLEGFV